MVTLLTTKLAPMLAAEAAAPGMHHALPAWAAWGKGNVIVEKFFEGGPVMWPILAVLVVAVAVIFERLFWWIREGSRRDPAKLDKVYSALESGNISAAAKEASGAHAQLGRT